jgi:ribose 5-phosphate isomerase B
MPAAMEMLAKYLMLQIRRRNGPLLKRRFFPRLSLARATLLRMKRIGFAADHAGFSLKATLVLESKRLDCTSVDFGTDGARSVDYPDFAQQLCRALARNEIDLGVLVCGTGIGMSIAANRFSHVRAALCRTEFEARATRSHNDANVLCLGERVTGIGVAQAIFEVFLETPFEGGRHLQRLDKLNAAQ